jgi:hypothetical protein
LFGSQRCLERKKKGIRAKFIGAEEAFKHILGIKKLYLQINTDRSLKLKASTITC